MLQVGVLQEENARLKAFNKYEEVERVQKLAAEETEAVRKQLTAEADAARTKAAADVEAVREGAGADAEAIRQEYYALGSACLALTCPSLALPSQTLPCSVLPPSCPALLCPALQWPALLPFLLFCAALPCTVLYTCCCYCKILQTDAKACTEHMMLTALLIACLFALLSGAPQQHGRH